MPPTHPEGRRAFYEPLVTSSYVAPITSRVVLGTCVLAAPQEPMAKRVSTPDRLSGGRVLLGVGAGWIGEEVEAFGVDYRRRLSYLREFIRVLRLAGDSRGRNVQVFQTMPSCSEG